MRLKLPNVAACCIAMAICLACFPRACWAQSNTQNKSSTQNKRFDLQKLERQIKQVVATVQPATVAIIEPNQPEFSGATGVIVSSEGHILTAGHCVFQPGTKFKIVLPDGRNFPAVGMGMEPSLDCGLIKIESEKLADAKLPTVKMGWSSELKVNQPCISLGHSGGFNRKRGAVIRFGRIAETLSPSNAMIRSTCLMEPGDSGGPLFDQTGNVIGVNTAIFSPSGGNVGIGFAIPAAVAEKVIASLKETGRVERGWLGVAIQPIGEDMAEGLGLDDKAGALVAEVMDESPAQVAGLQRGDVIRAIDGREMKEPKDVSRTVADFVAGQSVEFDVWRNGKAVSVDVEIGAYPETDQVAAAAPADMGVQSVASLGVTLEESEAGVVIRDVDPASDAALKGLRPGDIILEAGGQKVAPISDFAADLEAATEAHRKSLLLLVRSGEGQRFVAVRLQST